MLTATIQNVLNRGLPRSPRAQQLCAQLAGRKICVELGGVTRVLIESDGTSLKVARAPQGATADATIAGGPFGLLALAGSAPEAVIQRGDVRIEGDAELAERFQELARLLQPDLEEELSVIVGDVPAHQIGRLARTVFGWTRRTAATTARNVAEYLGHERRDLVPRSEAEAFLTGVDQAREAVDRLAARVDILARQRDPNHP